MTELLFLPALAFIIVSAFVRKPALWALLAGVCTVLAWLAALLLGTALNDLVLPLLVLGCASLWAVTRKGAEK